MRKYLSNVHKMEGANLQCMNNHYTLAHKHQFKILLKERCEIDYLHRLVLTSMWSEKQHHKSAKKSIKLS